MHLLMQHLSLFEMDSDDGFSGFYAKNVELVVTVYPGMFTDANCRRIQLTKPQRSWHLQLWKQLRRWDAYNWSGHFGRCGWFTTKKPVDWTSSWVSSHSIYRCSQRDSLAEQYGDMTLLQWQQNIFILDIRFLSNSVLFVVLYVVIVMYLYLFLRINYICMP